MSKIDPELLEKIDEGQGITIKKDSYGNALAFKGPWLPDYFDNYTECVRENQNARRSQLLRASSLNEHGQTKEQAKAFEDKKRVQLIRKQKSEDALLASETFRKGN